MRGPGDVAPGHTSRIVGCNVHSVLKLIIDAGQVFSLYQDRVLRNLSCRFLELDEQWSFIYAKEKRVKAEPGRLPANAGDVWTWAGTDRETKLVPAWRVGDRSQEMANAFVEDLAKRLSGRRVQTASDAYAPYVEAIEKAFRGEVDYAMLKKEHRTNTPHRLTVITGHPNPEMISTSIAERSNLTMRMSNRRFTRKTNAFSKRLENHACAVSLHFMHYNFCRRHMTLKTTPAIAAGVTARKWSIGDMVQMVNRETKPGPRGPYKRHMSN